MNLTSKHCVPNAPILSAAEVDTLLRQVPGWMPIDGMLRTTFSFRNYHETIAFVNALAWMSNHQDHHPEMLVTFKLCAVGYHTHSANGELTENDFICAAKASALYAQRAVA